jgi:hypothetical protein
LTDYPDNLWLHLFPGLLERWREECRLVEERFSLFRAFAEAPFLGFRGIVARSGSEYRVTVAAEMDFYPQRQPWVFVTPPIAGANADGKLSVDVSWSPEGSRFAGVVGAVIAYVEAVCRVSNKKTTRMSLRAGSASHKSRPSEGFDWRHASLSRDRKEARVGAMLRMRLDR